MLPPTLIQRERDSGSELGPFLATAAGQSSFQGRPFLRIGKIGVACRSIMALPAQTLLTGEIEKITLGELSGALTSLREGRTKGRFCVIF